MSAAPEKPLKKDKKNPPKNGGFFSRQEETYTGEYYIPQAEEKDFEDHRTREKGYSMIAAILHVIPGFLPAMALNTIYAAIFYFAGLALIICITVTNYRAPSRITPLTRPQYNRFVLWAGRFTIIQRLVVILTVIFVIIFNYMYGLGITIWFILQIALFLLEALALQFLFRLQRNLRWEAKT